MGMVMTSDFSLMIIPPIPPIGSRRICAARSPRTYLGVHHRSDCRWRTAIVPWSFFPLLGHFFQFPLELHRIVAQVLDSFLALGDGLFAQLGVLVATVGH